MSYTWNIYWNSIFYQSKNESCKVRFRLVSNSSNTLSNENIGSLRISLQSNTSNVTNGFNIGNIQLKKNGNNYYLEGNTLETEGVTMIIPKVDNSNLTLSLYDRNEELMKNPINYQVYLYFDY